MEKCARVWALDFPHLSTKKEDLDPPGFTTRVSEVQMMFISTCASQMLGYSYFLVGGEDILSSKAKGFH